MNRARPYVRAFITSGIWFAAVGIRMVSRHSGSWDTYPPRNYAVLVVAFLLTALVVGFAAAHWRKLQSWLAIGIATVVGCFVILGVMLVTVERLYGLSAPPKFKTADQMMIYFAAEATKWVKADRGLDLNYSLDSVKVIEEELARISNDLNKTNPPQGTFGLATGYGAYVGEVFRRQYGGSWAVDHPTAGTRSYPLTTRSNVVIFPVGWCWKRLTAGDEDNVYLKALAFAQLGSPTNAAASK